MTHLLSVNWFFILLLGALLLIRHRYGDRISGCCGGHKGRRSNRYDPISRDVDGRHSTDQPADSAGLPNRQGVS